ITLGSFLILQGANLAITKIFTGNVATDSISDMDGFDQAKKIFASEISIGDVDVKITVFYWLVFAAAATWLLLRTKFGNWIFATGGNKESARAVGVPVTFTKIALFMGVGAGAWFVGMHILFSFNTVQSGEGVGNEFLYIIAAVIGGCLLTGGYGSAIGPVIGAFIFGMVSQGIVYANWNPDWFKAFLGVMLLLAALVNLWVRRQATRR
ncbi:ABC transporter permease, partial [Streptomyces sp. IB201691-2A2]|uniref:ABC transporter permease n=3 Tax=Streptomyces TaxID=1883 RepID=UPI00118149B0